MDAQGASITGERTWAGAPLPSRPPTFRASFCSSQNQHTSQGGQCWEDRRGACETIPSPPAPSPAGLPPPLPTTSPPHRREGAKVCGGNSPLPSLGAVILKEEQMGALAWMQHWSKRSRSPSTDVPGGAESPPPAQPAPVALPRAEGWQGTVAPPPLQGPAPLTEVASTVSAVPA